jgi:hypothetical protein
MSTFQHALNLTQTTIALNTYQTIHNLHEAKAVYDEYLVSFKKLYDEYLDPHVSLPVAFTHLYVVFFHNLLLLNMATYLFEVFFSRYHCLLSSIFLRIL